MPHATHERAQKRAHTPTVNDLRTSGKAALTVSEVAALLGLDERTVRRACEDGQLPAVRVGRRILIPRERLLPLLTAAADCDTLAPTAGPIPQSAFPMEVPL